MLKFILFADDTSIFCLGNDPVQLSKDVSKELSKLSTWFAVNTLLLFSNYKKTSKINVNVNDIDIGMIFVSQFLSVLIDHKLNWKDHVNTIVSKLSKSIAIMHRAKYALDKNTCLILYYSLFLPYVSYCCEVWENIYKTKILNAFIYYRENNEDSVQCRLLPSYKWHMI